MMHFKDKITALVYLSKMVIIFKIDVLICKLKKPLILHRMFIGMNYDGNLGMYFKFYFIQNND